VLILATFLDLFPIVAGRPCVQPNRRRKATLDQSRCSNSSSSQQSLPVPLRTGEKHEPAKDDWLTTNAGCEMFDRAAAASAQPGTGGIRRPLESAILDHCPDEFECRAIELGPESETRAFLL
jgi:hypothetical protein